MGAIVLLPLGVDDAALDRCLAALDAGTAVWLADDAQAGPRAQAVVEHWLAHTPLQAEYTRRARPLGEVAHLDEMLRACEGLDVAVLAPDSVPAPGWLQRLRAAFARDAAIATATPWCNAGETAAWPRLGEINPEPADTALLAHTCASLPNLHPELPSAVTHAVLVRGNARRRAGGLDTDSYLGWNAALVDLSLRMAGAGLAQRVVRKRLRQPRRRGGQPRGRSGGPGRALAGLDASAGRFPHARPAACAAR